MSEQLPLHAAGMENKPWHMIHNEFAATEYGLSLHGQPRWDRYRPDHISPDKWKQILGADADNLEHMKLTYGLTRQFLMMSEKNGETHSDEDKSLLLLSSLIHDWGESSTANRSGGDINWELKTVEDFGSEREIFSEIFSEMLGNEHIKTQLMAEKVIFEPDSRLGQVFNAIERVGYMRSAIRAYEQSKSCDDEVLSSHLRWLCAGVLSNQTVRLLDYSKVYSPISEYLEKNREHIDEAFDNLDDSIFTEHGQSERMRSDLYRIAKNTWYSTESAPGKKRKSEELHTKGIFGSSANVEARFMRDYDEVEDKVGAMRSLGLSVVLTSGSFDLPHIGHARYIAKAHEYGDMLVVGVDSDTKIQKRKGPERPVVPESERIQMLAHLRDVDLLTLKYPGDTKWELIKRVRPDTLIATAETYSMEEINELEKNYCGRVVVLEPQATTSTSARIRRLEVGYRQQILGPVERVLEAHEVPEEVRRQIGEIILNARKNA